jgi:hypothetical protein
MAATMADPFVTQSIPLFGVRKFARGLLAEIDRLRAQNTEQSNRLRELGALTMMELEARQQTLESELAALVARRERESQEAMAAIADSSLRLETVRRDIVETEELALLQEAGIYQYRHPVSDAVAYQVELAKLAQQIKAMVRKDSDAIEASTSWTVNGSVAQGRAMVRDFSKLMLRAFNAEADNLVRGLKPYKLSGAIDRLQKVAATIERLGKTMSIRISDPYRRLRIRELELTADFLQKEAEEKEIERVEKERLREERKAQQEMERQRQKLEKERQHFTNALNALVANGDEAGAQRMREQLDDVQRAIDDVDYRQANIRAGYVYAISNLGSFGEEMVKVGMTRRLDPLDRIRELSDASVPFNFDVHALFFSKDAVGIELAMHARLATSRVNHVNLRREFFRVTPAVVKAHLIELAGELLQFQDIPEALEYRESLTYLEAARKRDNVE